MRGCIRLCDLVSLWCLEDWINTLVRTFRRIQISVMLNAFVVIIDIYHRLVF